MILLIDNYDSFSYNLYQAIGKFSSDIKVIRNDEYSVNEIFRMNPRCIIISPGPGKPEDAGICVELIKKNQKHIPILGICLGHQAICLAYGVKVSYAKSLMHGKSSVIRIANDAIFKNLPEKIEVARYHSLSAVKESMNENLKVLSVSEDDEIMAVKHSRYPVYGLQFHPESILTPNGEDIIRNFLEIAQVELIKFRII